MTSNVVVVRKLYQPESLFCCIFHKTNNAHRANITLTCRTLHSINLSTPRARDASCPRPRVHIEDRLKYRRPLHPTLPRNLPLYRLSPIPSTQPPRSLIALGLKLCLRSSLLGTMKPRTIVGTCLSCGRARASSTRQLRRPGTRRQAGERAAQGQSCACMSCRAI